MELVTIVLIIAPIAGYFMERYGLGAYKHAESFVQDISIQEARQATMFFANTHNWRFKNQYEETDKITMIYQVGQWGFSMQGAQAVILIFTQETGGTSVSVDSTSMMGQIADFGANQRNLDEFTVFLTDTATHREKLDTYKSYGNLIRPNHFIINPVYWLIIWGCIFSLFVRYYLTYKDKQRSIPGNVIIMFKQGYTQEQSYENLGKFGAGSCQNRPPESLTTFLCAVPVGLEDKVLDNAHASFTVESATRWHGE
ncbi:MAG: hypothetical protein RI947_1558 [Candidatus Parcubacteria bacterium]|jgi:hypothetical protein